MTPRRRLVRRALIVLAPLGLVACGGQPDSTATTATPTTTFRTVPASTADTTAAPSTSTTLEPTTTMAETTTTVAETTTTVPAGPVFPLTGLPAPDPFSVGRVALVVKIDNAPGARPQTGFNAADLVVEEIVNDNLTRFAMVFQSQSSNPVGPIRSGRLQDIDLFSMLNHPLFAWSGGNATVTRAIDSSDLVNVGPNHVHAYYRDSSRAAPHNLYSKTDDLWANAPADSSPPPQLFDYLAPGESPAGDPTSAIAIKLDSIDVRWDWDDADHRYLRTMEGKAHNDKAGGQISTDNVVVLSMDYTPGISGSPDAQTVGDGEVFVLTGGRMVHGTWARADIHDRFTLTADDGTPIRLTPGRTFIELPRVSSTLPIP